LHITRTPQSAQSEPSRHGQWSWQTPSLGVRHEFSQYLWQDCSPANFIGVSRGFVAALGYANHIRANRRKCAERQQQAAPLEQQNRRARELRRLRDLSKAEVTLKGSP
jgi:hypothetical protein